MLEAHMEAMLSYGQRHQNKRMNPNVGTTYQQEAPPFLSKDEIALLKRTTLAKFSQDHQDTFIRRCERAKLDPFSGQIHPTLRNTKVRDEDGSIKYVPTLVCVTGIYGLTALAVRTGEYNGCEITWTGKDGKWKDAWLEKDFPLASRCIVHHKHRDHPEVAIARWDSFVQQKWNKDTKSWEIAEFWDRLSDYMLAKCAKAAALRGAFPDQLSEIYIREELPGLESESVSTDEQKVADSQKRDTEVAETLQKTGKAKVVTMKPEVPVPTPEEALEPAFEEDKKPPTQVQKDRPTFEKEFQKLKEDVAPQVKVEDLTPPRGKTLGEKIAAEYPQAKVVTAAEMPKVPSFEDNLDLSPAPAEQQEEEAPAPAGPPPEPPWKSHVIRGVRHVKFQGRKIGDLNQAELAIIETQWLPAIREDWDNASQEQQEDAPMFEAAIAFYKMAKPW